MPTSQLNDLSEVVGSADMHAGFTKAQHGVERIGGIVTPDVSCADKLNLALHFLVCSLHACFYL